MSDAIHPLSAATPLPAARLLPVRRFLVIVLLAFLPLQFSWAAVAAYCGHEEPAGATHVGHHEHQHHEETAGNAEPVADLDVTEEGTGEKSPGAMDLDCSHCHGTCGAMLTLLSGVPGALSTVRPSAALDEAGGAHAPTRPERPQWLPLA